MRAYLLSLSSIFKAAGHRFFEIMGTDRAASFAYYGLFSLFPLLTLVVSIGSNFFDLQQISTVVSEAVSYFLPIDFPLEKKILATTQSFIQSRGKLSFLAFLLLAWGSTKFLNTLVSTINLSWGLKRSKWWLRSLKNLALIAILSLTLMWSLLFPAAFHLLRRSLFYFRLSESWPQSNVQLLEVVPFFALYLGIIMLLYLAPQKKVPLRFVWREALLISLLLRLTQVFFTLFLSSTLKANPLYGAFGELMSLLIWIHLCGVLVIFGACLSSAHYHLRSPSRPS